MDREVGIITEREGDCEVERGADWSVLEKADKMCVVPD
jgi:hypothetical protein